MKKRVMILGSLEEFVQLVQMAKERGIYTVVCDGNAEGPAKKYADRAYDVDVRETKKIAGICRKEQVDGILTAFSDLLLECMVKIADEAGLPCYLKPEQAVFYRDKSVMKQMFQEIGVGTPKFVKLKRDFSTEDLEGMHFPVVVKPVDKYGSRGIFVLNREAEIREYFEICCETSDIKEILAEEYHSGYEFNLMAWVLDGEVHILSIADREKTPIGGRGIPISTRNVYPSCLIDEVDEEAKQILEKVIRYTGQKDGQLSMQFFWKKGQKIQVCEVAARFLGYEHELIEYCSGLSVEELMLDAVCDPGSLGRKLKNHSPKFSSCGAVLYFQGKEEKISDLSQAERCMKLPEVKAGWLFYAKGETVQEFVRPYVARCYITGKNREEVDCATDRIFDGMSIKNREGGEILYQNRRMKYDKES